MGYQRNIGSGEDGAEEDVLDKPLERLVGEKEVDADDQAGDQDDHGALDQLLLPGPFDLVQLGPRLADELRAGEAPPWTRRGAVLAAGGRDGRAHGGTAGALDGGLALGLGRAAGAALGACLPGHG